MQQLAQVGPDLKCRTGNRLATCHRKHVIALVCALVALILALLALVPRLPRVELLNAAAVVVALGFTVWLWP